MLLAIETSCDETSLALIGPGPTVLKNMTYSQIKTHAKFGGIIPEYASRMHTEKIHSLLDALLKSADCQYSDLTAIGVTYGPGLEGALLVGLTLAKTLGNLLNIPVIGVNHLHGHIYSSFLCETQPQFPFICLVVSGGHTMLVLVKDHFQFEILGETRDDAAGEAFDKVARACKLPYPGGPYVEKMAKEGRSDAFPFPKPMLHQGYAFSFSGLKTAFVQTLHTLTEPYPVEDLCASFQSVVTDLLVTKTRRAAEDFGCTSVVLCGGVAANKTLRNALEAECEAQGWRFSCPPFEYCTDNGAMIGVAAYYYREHFGDQPLVSPQVKSNLPL